MWRARLLAGGLALLASAGCKKDAAPGAPLVNQCAQDVECVGDNWCDSKLNICARDSVDRPYSFGVQVIAQALPGEIPLASVALGPQLLTARLHFGNVTVPYAVLIKGSVSDASGDLLEAELAFTPSQGGPLASGVSAFTQPVMDNPDDQFYVVALAPDTRYDVTVFPLGADSEKVPPGKFQFSTTTFDQTETFRFPAQVSLSATLLDEDQKPAERGFKVRLRNKATQEASSSVGRIELNGKFTLQVDPEVLAALDQHELVLSVQRRGEDELVSIAFPGSQLRQGGTLVMPTIPTAVLFSALVEVGELQNAGPDVSAVNANVTFVSSFVPPADVGAVGGSDWCRLRLPGSPPNSFGCSATVTASVGRDRTVTANLLPGDYKIFVAPTGAPTDQIRVATTELSARISTQPDGTQEGRVFQVSRANLYTGIALSEERKAMPKVTVTAIALGVQGNLPEVALYNRTAEQTSAPDGTFELAVDTGFYDLVAAPMDGTGFAWALRYYNRQIGPERLHGNSSEPDFTVMPQIPVLAQGVLLTRDGQPVVGARVEGYAIVPDLQSGGSGQRAVRIARTISDTTGAFSLLLPREVGDPEDAAPATAIDASAPFSAISRDASGD